MRRRGDRVSGISLMGLGCAKTKSDLVVMPSGRQIFMFFCSPHDHRAQNSGYGYTAWSFYTARVINCRAGLRPSAAARHLITDTTQAVGAAELDQQRGLA